MNGYDINDDNYLQKMFIDQVKPCLNGGGGDIPAVIQALTVTENGTYEAPEGVDGYGPVIVNVSATGDGYDVLNALLERSITEISSNITSISDYAFYKCSALTTANFPVATSIGAYAFRDCTELSTVDLPVVTSIGAYSFDSCTNLSTVNLPAVTSIGNGAFSECPFTELTTTNFPALTSIGNNAFDSCTKLTIVNLPALTSIGNYAFDDCTNLSTVNLPAATSIGGNAFRYCSKLTTVDISAATSIGDYAFQYCSKLTVLILRSETMAALPNENAFNNIPIAKGTGYIYVPRALIEDYKVASNWSTYADQFRALEDYTVDGTTTGALDESKI